MDTQVSDRSDEWSEERSPVDPTSPLAMCGGRHGCPNSGLNTTTP